MFNTQRIKLIQENFPSGDLERVRSSLTNRIIDMVYDIPKHGKTTLLQYAVSNQRVDLVKFLLECGADPNADWQHTETVGYYKHQNVPMSPLILACTLPNQEEIIHLLLANGADPNYSYSALFQEKYLLLHANITLKEEKYTICPLWICCKYKTMQYIPILIEYGAKYTDEFYSHPLVGLCVGLYEKRSNHNHNEYFKWKLRELFDNGIFIPNEKPYYAFITLMRFGVGDTEFFKFLKENDVNTSLPLDIYFTQGEYYSKKSVVMPYFPLEEMFSLSLGIPYPQDKIDQSYKSNMYDIFIMYMVEMGENLYGIEPYRLVNMHYLLSKYTPFKIILSLMKATPKSFYAEYPHIVKNIVDLVKEAATEKYYRTQFRFLGIDLVDLNDVEEKYKGEHFVIAAYKFGINPSIVSLFELEFEKF